MKFLCVALLFAVASARPQSGVVPGEYAVFLKPGVVSAAAANLLQGKITHENVGQGRTYLQLNDVSDELASLIEASPLVDLIEQSQYVFLDESEQPGESGSPAEYLQLQMDSASGCTTQAPPAGVGSGNIYHLARVSYRGHGAVNEHTPFHYASTGDDADVAIMDTGISYSNNAGEFGGRASHVWTAFATSDDGHGHGTHVAGIVGSRTYGVAKGCNLLSYKVLDDNGAGSTAGIAAGIEHLATHMNSARRNVMNMSLGGPNSTAMRLAIDHYVANGGFAIAAAGNSAADASNAFPASYDNVISVGATDINNNFASFSNWGSSVDVSAAGVAVWSTMPSGNPMPMSGTSMACPVVAGVAARGQDTRDSLVNNALNGAINFSNSNQETTPNRLLHMNDC